MSSSLIFTNSGKIAIATSIMNQELYVGWGDIPPFVPAPLGVTASPIAGNLPAGTYNYVVTYKTINGETNISNLVTIAISNDQGIELTIPDADNITEKRVYGRTSTNLRFIGSTTSNKFIDTGTLNLTSAVIPTENTTSYNVWGLTAVPPPVNIDHVQLLREFVRRKVLVKSFVIRDTSGEIITREGRWTKVNYPTTNVYLSTTFEIEDGEGSIVYQKGVFVGTTPKPGFENRNILFPNQIDNFGALLGLRNIVPLARTGSSRYTEEVVLVF